MGNLENTLLKLIKEFRNLSNEHVKSDDLTEEQLYYIQEGYKEGLAAAALMLAEELDVKTNFENEYLEHEEDWWYNEIKTSENE